MKCLLMTPCLLALALVVTTAPAADIFIRDAKIWTLDRQEIVDRGNILVSDGKIAAVGELAAPADVIVIEARGKQVTPGLINSYTQLGMVEIKYVAHTNDSATVDTQFSAAYNIATAINPHSTLIPQNRINGLTRAIVVPLPGHHLFSGQAAAIRLGTGADFLLDDNAALFAMFGAYGGVWAGGSRAAAWLKMRQAFLDAREYNANRKAVRSGNWRELSMPLHDLDALIQVLDGEKPLVVIVNRASDIRAMLQLKKAFNLNLVIAGGAEAWMLAGALATADVPVMLDPMMNVPKDFDQLAVRMDGAARLHEAGVTLLLAGGTWVGSHTAWLVRQSAGNAVAWGMPAVAAIRAMTVNPARVFGLSERYGTIEPGKDADLVIWDGDPLEVMTRADQVIIAGELIHMVSRSTRLRDRYRTLHNTHEQLLRK